MKLTDIGLRLMDALYEFASRFVGEEGTPKADTS